MSLSTLLFSALVIAVILAAVYVSLQMAAEDLTIPDDEIHCLHCGAVGECTSLSPGGYEHYKCPDCNHEWVNTPSLPAWWYHDFF